MIYFILGFSVKNQKTQQKPICQTVKKHPKLKANKNTLWV